MALVPVEGRSDEWHSHAHRVWRVLGGGIAEYDIEASDERLSGTAKYVANGLYLDSADQPYPAQVIVGTVVIEAAEGTWEGSFVGLDYPGTPDNGDQHILAGTGAYEGLNAVMTTRDDVTSGLIFPGDLPEPRSGRSGAIARCSRSR